MMEGTNITLLAVMLVVGLLIGAGVGYYMAPVEITDEVITQPQEIIHQYEPSIVSWFALALGIINMGILAYFLLGSKVS